MLLRLILVCFICLASFASAELAFDIHPEGHARLEYDGHDPEVAWVVRCNRPMRDCAARSGHALVRVSDDKVALSLFSVKGTSLVLTDDSSEAWTSSRMSSLSLQDITTLDALETYVVLVGARGPETLTRLHGIKDVVAYLRWLQTDEARAVRDARLWPENGELDQASLEGQALFRYQELLRRRAVKVTPIPEVRSFISPL